MLAVLQGLVLLAGTAPATEPAPVVAVFMLENRGTPLSQDEVSALTEYLATKLGESGRYQIIPTAEIRRRLVNQKLESYKKCYDQSCQIEIGRELAAQFTVSASVARVGSQCLVTAALYDLRKAATERTATGRGECSADALLLAIEQAAVKLAADQPGGTPPAPGLPAHMSGQPTTQPAPWPPQNVQPTAAAAPQQIIVAPMERRTKSPWAAMGWGLLLPGGGLFYCEKYAWGAIYLVGTVGAFAVGVVGSIETDDLSWFAIGVGSGLLIDLVAIVHGMTAAAQWTDPAYEAWRRSVLEQSAPQGPQSWLLRLPREPGASASGQITFSILSFRF